jgi:cytidylate kinase
MSLPLEALIRSQSLREGGAPPARAPFTVAITRQAGSRGTTIARLVGNKLAWPVYDKELLLHIGQEAGWQAHQLEPVDEKRVNWFQEAMNRFLAVPGVPQTAYLRRLADTLMSLAARGQCVIVGRGAAQLLPPPTTLRVRIVADLADRVAYARQELGLTEDEAPRWVERTNAERLAFVRDNFHKDPEAADAHDLVVNTSRFTPEECADLIVEALRRLQGRAPLPHAAKA